MLRLFLGLTFISSANAYSGELTMAGQISEGGVAIVVILLLSILLVSVGAERFINFRKKNIYRPELIGEVTPLWIDGHFQKIRELLSVEDNTLSRMLYFVASNHKQSYEFVRNGAAEIASLELRRHQQKAYALAIVATVAPIVGLLGTVIGMIEAFHVIAYSQGMGNPALLAGGISKALINTAAGLSVALPALGLHHFFRNRSASFGLLLEQTLNQLMNEWFVSGGPKLSEASDQKSSATSDTHPDFHEVHHAN
jgi:biopolymer transport protein ExbB